MDDPRYSIEADRDADGDTVYGVLCDGELIAGTYDYDDALAICVEHKAGERGVWST